MIQVFAYAHVKEGYGDKLLTIWDTYSKRQKQLSGVADVFTYDEIPKALRVQIWNIWQECFGDSMRAGSHNPAYVELHKRMANELGMLAFPPTNHRILDADLIKEFFINSATTREALDMIDMAFRYAIHMHKNRRWSDAYDAELLPLEAIEQLNARLLQHGVGYSFIDGDSPQLIRKDNEHLHQEAVLPALCLLHEEGFAGADAEYRKAHEHYRHGRYKECLNECLKAFESTLKTICSKRKWARKETDTAKTLIDTCLTNGLLPAFMQSHLGTVKSALESAIPTVRNKLSGHGQGEQPKAVPEFYAEYLLHETAATIVFLVSAYKHLE